MGEIIDLRLRNETNNFITYYEIYEKIKVHQEKQNR